jgi:hypothetical protein
MTVYCKIIDYGKSICKDYYFIRLLIDVKLSSSLKGYLCKSNYRESQRVSAYALIGFSRAKISEENVLSEGDAMCV